MKIEPIDLSQIRGKYQETGYYDGNPNRPFVSGGDDTVRSIKLVAEKINEIIEKLNEN